MDFKIDDQKIADIKQHCRKFQHFLERIEDDLFFWAGKKHIAKVFETKIKQLGDRTLVDSMPQGWYLMTKKAFCFARMFENKTNAGKVVKAYSDELTDSDLDFLKTFQQNSWYLSLFSVKERITKDLFVIYDFWKDGEYLIKSSSLEELFNEGKTLFFSLVFDNGECLQSYGVLNYFQGLVPEDFETFAKLANPKLYEQKGFRYVLNHEMVAFFLLYAYAEMPALGSGGERIYFHASRIKCKGFDTTSLEHYYAGEVEDITKWTISFDEKNILGASLYFDSKHKTFTVYSTSLEDYTTAVDLLSDLIAVPAEPQYKVSTIIQAAAEDILGKPLPGAEYDTLFGSTDETDLEEEEDQILEASYFSIAQSVFEGKKIDPEKSAEVLGIPRIVVENLLNQANKNVGNFYPPVSGGLKGFKTPDSETLKAFLEEPEECGLFTLASDDDVEPLLEEIKARMERSSDGWDTESLDMESIRITLYSFIAHLYNNEYYFLNLIIYMLLKKGDKPFSYQDYAVELLRAGWFLFIVEPDADAIHSTIQNFGLLCLRALEPTGLIDIVGDIDSKSWEGQPFKIKRSAFFEAWVREKG